jgi:hypothetical protein
MAAVALLRSPVAAKVVEVGTFDDHASPLAVLVFGGTTEVRIPVTPEEARMLGARLGEVVTFRLAVEG